MNIDKHKLKKLTREELNPLVQIFELLIKMDQKQNPDLYKNNQPLEKGRLVNRKRSK